MLNYQRGNVRGNLPAIRKHMPVGNGLDSGPFALEEMRRYRNCEQDEPVPKANVLTRVAKTGFEYNGQTKELGRRRRCNIQCSSQSKVMHRRK